MRNWGSILSDGISQAQSSRAFRLLRPVWLVTVLVVAGWYLVAHRAQIFSQPLSFSTVALAFGLTLAGKLFAALQVRLALARCGARLSTAASFYAYSMSDVGKYIPGGIWSVVSRVGLYRALHLRARVIAQTLVIEQIWYAGAALLTGAALYFFHGTEAWEFAVAPLLFLAALLFVMNRFMPSPGSVPGVIGLLLAQLCQWLLLGAGFAALLPEAASFGHDAGAFLIAFAAGMAVPFAPGGIGVREAVTGILLVPFHSAAVIGYVVLLSRAVWILADIAFAIIVTTTCRRAWQAAVTARNDLAA
jgi:hypothetical protein